MLMSTAMVDLLQGTERFQITKVVKEKPVLICEVEVLAEDEAQDEEVGRGVGGRRGEAGVSSR